MIFSIRVLNRRFSEAFHRGQLHDVSFLLDAHYRSLGSKLIQLCSPFLALQPLFREEPMQYKQEMVMSEVQLPDRSAFLVPHKRTKNQGF